jgi:hypothetical protein
MSVVHFDAPDAQPVRRPMALHGAKVSQGSRGDWNATVWLRTESEAVELAALINAHLGRKPRAAEAGEP